MVSEDVDPGRRNQKMPPLLQSSDQAEHFLVVRSVVELCWEELLEVQVHTPQDLRPTTAATQPRWAVVIHLYGLFHRSTPL